MLKTISISTILASTLALTVPQVQASWLTAIGKTLKGADEAAGTAKVGVKGGSSAVNELGDATKASQTPTPNAADSLTSDITRHPWALSQLSRCIAHSQAALNQEEATRRCMAAYEQCVQRKNPKHSSAQPLQICIQETNR